MQFSPNFLIFAG